jgi:hypothetical protein
MVNVFVTLLFAVDKNTIPTIHKGIEINANIHNHRLMNVFVISHIPTVSLPTTPNIRNTKLTKSQSTPTITGENVNHHHNFLFIFLHKN